MHAYDAFRRTRTVWSRRSTGWGNQKRLDRRYKDRKVWLPRNYFQIYHKTRNWEPDPGDRVAVGESARAPEIRVQRVRASKEIPSVVRAPRRKAFAK